MTARRSREEDTQWMQHGRCRSMSPDVFFPNDGTGFEVARRICQDCPVRIECLEYAVTNGITEGVWGGSSQRERARIRAAQRRAAAGKN